ncbi:MAG: FliG C-terminal domain-containing protein [Thermoguttaceae bacterium]|nr:FliG C-terminal domain-containing protein [Thermoguttaceae bacterium]
MSSTIVEKENLDITRDVAILTTLLDTDAADALLEPLSADLAQRIRDQMMRLSMISPDDELRVLRQFYQKLCGSQSWSKRVRTQSRSASRKMNEPRSQRTADQSVDANDSDDSEEACRDSSHPFAFLSRYTPERLVPSLVVERPQSIALVLAYLPPEIAGACLERLPPRIQVEVIRRLTDFEPPEAVVMEEVLRVLCQRLESSQRGLGGETESFAVSENYELSDDSALFRRWIPQAAATAASLGTEETLLMPDRPVRGSRNASVSRDATKRVAAILDSVSQGSGLRILENLAAYAPTLVKQFRRPDLEFHYADLDRLAPDALASLLRSLDDDLLAIAMLGADPAQIERWLRGFPGNRAAMLRKRLCGEATGPIRLGDVEEARKQIAAVATRWILEGRMTPPRRAA